MRPCSALAAPVVCLVVALAVSGCGQTAQVRAYKTLAVAGHVYDAGMQAAAEAYAKGLLDDAAKKEVLAKGRHFYTAYQAAVLALAQAREGSPPDDLQAKIDRAVRLYEAFKPLVWPYIEGHIAAQPGPVQEDAP